MALNACHDHGMEGRPGQPPATSGGGDSERRLEEVLRRADDLAQALARREREMRALLDHLPALVYLKDASGAYTMVNEGMRQALGRPHDEIIGKTNRDLLPAHLAAQFDAEDAELIRTGQPQILEVPTDPSLIDRVPGVVYEARKALVRDAAGRAIGLAGISLDITQRKQAEQALRDGEERYRMLIESSIDGVWLSDLQGNLLYCSRHMAAMWGCDRPEELVGRSLLDLVSSADRAAAAAGLEQLRQAGGPCHLVLELARKDGARFMGEISAALVTDSQGRPQAIQSAVRDVTARQRTRVELAQLYLAEHERRRMAEALRDAGAALNASLDVEAVLDQTIAHLGRIAPCDAASLMLIDPQARRAHIARRRSSGQDDAWDGAAALWLDLDASPPLQQLADRRAPFIILDRQDAADDAGAIAPPRHQSWIGVPVLAGDQVAAILSAHKFEAGYYRPEHSTYLGLFAAQVGLALRNARLHAETARALEREQFLNEVARAVSGVSDFPAMVQMVTQLAADAVGADGASMGLMTPDGQRMTAPFVHGLPGLPEQALQSRGEGLLWRIARSGETVQIDNYAAHPQARPAWSAAGLRAFLGVPILAGEDRVGALGFFMLSPDRRFTPRDLALAVSIGRQVGGAVQRARLHERLQQMAHIDSLTGLHTRRRFFELAQGAFEQATRRGESIALLMLDVDGFKRINDRLGHIAGDQVLQKVAARCRSRLRGTDIIGRYGGDEFAVVLPGADPPHACRVAERLRVGVETAVPLRRPTAVTISLGIAVGDARSRSIEALVACADRALYEAKRAGGNRVVGP
jgi:diguanylate cyclase (GGDEF)-like protein/PAS domain S-box-containing protein